MKVLEQLGGFGFSGFLRDFLIFGRTWEDLGEFENILDDFGGLGLMTYLRRDLNINGHLWLLS